MNIELRSIRHDSRMSHETECFSAFVYVDGKKVGMVSNDGMGGPNYYDFDERPLEAYAATFPPVNCEWDPERPMAMDLELLIGDLLEAHLKAKEFKSLTRNKTVFKLKGSRDGEYRVVKVPFGPEIKSRMVAKYGDRIEYFLNERSSF